MNKISLQKLKGGPQVKVEFHIQMMLACFLKIQAMCLLIATILTSFWGIYICFKP